MSQEKIILLLLIGSLMGFKLPGKIQNKLDSLKKKISSVLNAVPGRELVLDVNEYEYPRVNETLRKIHRELWQDYYDCLKKRRLKIGQNRVLQPVGFTVLEGTSITLNCSFCISPAELHTIEAIDWLYNSTDDDNMRNYPIISADNTVISEDDATLTMYNIKRQQQGLYWCQMEVMQSAPYFLHVSDDTEPILAVRPLTALKAQHSQPPKIIPDLGLEISSSWTAWTACSTCDAVGKRVRYGYCMISRANSTKRRKKARRRKKNIALRHLVDNFLDIFGGKMPCRSWYTPREIQEIPQIRERSSEIMTGFCKVKCRRNVVFEVRDIKGNILESANNSAGIYSLLQGMPQPRPSAVRITLYKKYNEPTQLRCPGNLNSDVPITWKIAMKIIEPELIGNQSNGRIFIDSRDRLIFKQLLYSDRDIYSCWQRSELAGTIRLEPSAELHTDISRLDHRVVMLTAIPIVGVMLWVFWRAYRGRNRYTMR